MSPRRGARSAVDRSGLRSLLTGHALRAAMGIRDVGELLIAVFAAEDDHPLVEHDEGRDIIATVRDVVSRALETATLFVPSNILWRKPRDGDQAIVLKPRDAGATPGAPVALYGLAGDADAVPPWIDSAAGIYAPETVRVHSSGAGVVAEGTSVKLGENATRGVARLNDTVGPSATFSTWMTAIQTATGVPAPVGSIGTISSASSKVSSE